MKNKIIIIGGGIAGLIMGYELTKRGIKDYTILESSSSEQDLLSRSHIYYIHEQIEDIKHLLVEKHLQTFAYWKGRFFHRVNPLMANLYSQRITGRNTPTAINHIDGKSKAGYFPDSGDLQEIIKFYLSNQGGKVLYKSKVIGVNTKERTVALHDVFDYVPYKILINTTPMPMLLDMMKNNGIVEQKFEYSKIYIYKGQSINTQDLYQEIYIPEFDDSSFYRMLIYNDTVIAESSEDLGPSGKDLFHNDVKTVFGLTMGRAVDQYELKSGRFIPIKDQIRKSIIGELTDKFNIFSFGRYGTWSYKRSDMLPKDAKDLIELIGYKGIAL